MANTQLYTVSIIIICMFFLIIMVAGLYVNNIKPLLKEREYIKMEIKRSFSKREYKYWKNKLKKLYLQHIPLIGRFWR